MYERLCSAWCMYALLGSEKSINKRLWVLPRITCSILYHIRVHKYVLYTKREQIV